MSVYPDVITGVRSTLPIEHSSDRKVLKTEFENGRETRRIIQASIRRTISINYAPVVFEQANTLRRFYEDMSGSYQSFSFFMPQVEYYKMESAGTADGGEVYLRMPSKSSQGHTLYQNGIVLEPHEYTFIPNGGPDGEDTVALTLFAQPGDSFHWTFTGNLKIKARFSDSLLTISDVKSFYSSFNVELVGLEHDLT